MAASEGATANVGRSALRRRVVQWILLLRAVVVLALGLAFLISGDNRRVLGNFLATFWLASAVLTLAWVRRNRGQSGSRLALTAGLVAVAAAVIGLTRFLIEGVISPDAALALIGATAMLIGALRLLGAFRDDASPRPRRSRSIALGVGEVALGVVWIATDEVTRTVTTAVAVWALLAGTIMLIDAINARSVRE